MFCHSQDDISSNTTRSELSFVPTTDDDGKSITCRAENPNVNGLYLETMWKLNVVCKYSNNNNNKKFFFYFKIDLKKNTTFYENTYILCISDK